MDLSADGSNRIDLKGGGNLTYTMNPLGDVRLSGKYVLSGGSVRYNPPIISQKIFKITPDSYVEWIGNIADPAFNITAVETVRANVSSDGQDNRAVNFDISINIRNSLDDLEISFGLSAPEDLTMQNQWNSLTAEQRANQAMNLLIYNTYTGPGTTAKVSSENPLNSFIQKELNQWAQNNLKGVDLSFGIDSTAKTTPTASAPTTPTGSRKPLQQPRAGGHRRQVQHRRRPVAEPQGEPDRRHFAGIHADQARQHVPESIPPHRV
ncbi:MAG: translocation/assembly module TamB domain-containing protein [Alistipes finegoldii]